MSGWGVGCAPARRCCRWCELDPRCALTTRNPESGERDADTLRWIDETRGRVDGEVCFGVYADVVEPGDVRVGDTVEPLAKEGR